MAEGLADAARLSEYVEVWWQAVNDFTGLLETIPAERWTTPTDLPGWDVHAVAAHTAHLEAILAGAAEETVEVGQPDHVTGLMGLYTEQGVVARRDRTPDELINEIRETTTARHTTLLADPPTDPSGLPKPIFAGVPWTWERLLRNRPLDIWMHEQDVRRALGQQGGLDSTPAKHTADYLTESLPIVVAKRAGAPAGTTVVLQVAGSPVVAAEVGDDGRGRLVEPPADPTVTLRMDREPFIVLAGGRRRPGDGAVQIEGDQELGRKILGAMAVTP